MGTGCNDVSKNYYLEIAINNETQVPRRLLTNFDYLRKDANEELNGNLITKGHLIMDLKGTDNIVVNGILRNMTRGVMRFQHIPIVPNTRVITFDIDSNGQENTSAIVMEYALNASDLIRHNTATGMYTWDKNADLHVRDVFARFIGSLTNRLTKLFVQDIIASGNVNATNYTLNGITIQNWCDISSGAFLTAGGNYLYNDSTSIYLNETKLNNTIDVRALTTNLTNYALKNQSETFVGNITIGGQIVTDNGCLVPHANFWAEENGGISSGGRHEGLEYAFGDGSKNSLGHRQPCSGRVVYLSIQATNAANGDGRVDIVINGNSPSTSSCNVATPVSNGNSSSNVCSLQFNSGDRLAPRTTITPSGTNDGYVVSWWVVYD